MKLTTYFVTTIQSHNNGVDIFWDVCNQNFHRNLELDIASGLSSLIHIQCMNPSIASVAYVNFPELLCNHNAQTCYKPVILFVLVWIYSLLVI